MSRPISAVSLAKVNSLDEIEESKKVTTPYVVPDQLYSIANSAVPFSTKVGGIPELAPPNEGIVEAGRCLEEMETFTQQLLQEPAKGDFFTTDDVDILRQLFACFTLQRELKQEKEIITHEDLKHQNEIQQELRQKYFNLKKQIKKQKKKAAIFGSVNLTAALALAGLVMLGFATGGVGAVIGAGIACASISQGATGITKGVLDHETSKKSGELFMVNEERDEIHREINDGVRELGEAIQGVMRTWQDLRKVITDRLDALRAIR